MEKELIINQRKIPLVVRHSAKSRHLRLQVHTDTREVHLVIPRFVLPFEVNRFVIEKTPWIEKQWEKIENQSSIHPKPKYKSGDIFYYMGRPLELTVRPCEKKRPSVRISADKLIIQLYHRVSEAEGVKMVKKTLEDFYRKKAEEIIHDRLEYFNEHYRFRYHRITLRNQKSRWGSCSTQKNLNFNWRLAMAPVEIIDYVVVHELCHLKEMNHSASFWKLVSEACPDYKKSRKWLKENQFMLKI